MTRRRKIEYPFTAVPNKLIDETLPGLLGSAVKVVLVLARETYGRQREWCSLTYEQIAERAGLKRSWTVELIGRLEDRKLIERHEDYERHSHLQTASYFRFAPTLTAAPEQDSTVTAPPVTENSGDRSTGQQGDRPTGQQGDRSTGHTQRGSLKGTKKSSSKKGLAAAASSASSVSGRPEKEDIRRRTLSDDYDLIVRRLRAVGVAKKVAEHWAADDADTARPWARLMTEYKGMAASGLVRSPIKNPGGFLKTVIEQGAPLGEIDWDAPVDGVSDGLEYLLASLATYHQGWWPGSPPMMLPEPRDLPPITRMLNWLAEHEHPTEEALARLLWWCRRRGLPDDAVRRDGLATALAQRWSRIGPWAQRVVTAEKSAADRVGRNVWLEQTDEQLVHEETGD